MQTNTTATLTALALAAIVAAPAGCGRKSDEKSELPPASGEGAPERPALPSVASTADTAGEQPATAGETTGTTYPKQRAEIGPNASGVIAQVAVEEGDHVKKGQLLFRMRADDAQLGVKQANAALATAKVNVSAIKVEYDRTQRLFEKTAIDQATWDRVQAQYDAARAGQEQAQVALSMAKKRLSDTSVRAPFDGIVSAKLKSKGETVTLVPVSVVVVVEDHDTLELRFRLPEREVGGLAEGQTVRALFDAGQEKTAKITRISPTVDARSRTVEVVADIDNADGALKAGMLARVHLGGARP